MYFDADVGWEEIVGFTASGFVVTEVAVLAAESE